MSFVPHAKITIPPLPPEYIARPTLRAELAAGDPAGVALVCAPAGYGKTLLLADWALTGDAEPHVDTAWVSLDRDDNDPRRLWASVVAAVTACPSVPPSSRLHDPWLWHTGAQPEFLAEFVDALDLLPRPIRLVLDDLHELTGPEALHGLQILTRNRPGGVTLVLSSRLDPPLSLPRLRLAGQLWELRADRLRFSPAETAELVEKSGLALTEAQVEVLHQRTGGWAAGLRLATLGLAEAGDHDGFLAQFSGNERSVADYLVGEILSGMTEDVQEFLRSISISDPVPCRLAVELSGREDAGGLLDALEHQTSLVSPTGHRRDAYTVQELLRTYLLADLQRQGPRRAADLHATAARWWAGQGDAVRALDHVAAGRDPALLAAMMRTLAVPLLLAGEHAPLRRALATAGADATATDPWLALTSALTNIEAGELPAARGDLRHARAGGAAAESPDLLVLRTAVEQFGAVVSGVGAPPVAPPPVDELPSRPDLEALARLSRGAASVERGDQAGARTDLEAALALGRRHGFDYLTMQCLALLGCGAATGGDLRGMRAVCDEAVAAASGNGWETSMWSVAATTMLGYAALLRADAGEALRLTGGSLALGSDVHSAPLRFAVQVVHGAAVFDGGDRAGGLAELRHARSMFGDLDASAQQSASAAMLEFRAALLLGHSAAARTAHGWLADRTEGNAELLVMRAWTEAAGGRHEHARSLLRPVLGASVPALLPYTVVDAWLLETSLAVAIGERPAARRALQTALAVAEPLDVLRPFAQAGQSVRELLVHQHGSFGSSEAFADRALAAGAGRENRRAMLSERELTVLGLLPSLLSLDEIAADLTVSVNTVKSHVRSIYTKLGVSSRRLAVLAAHEHGLLTTGVRAS